MTEYVMIVGLAAAIFFAVSPLFRRGIQAVVKLTADQIAPQQNAEQRVTPLSGYLMENYQTTQFAHSKNVTEDIGIISYGYDDSDASITNSKSNLGFTNRYH